MLTQTDLKRSIAASPAAPPLTQQLEQEIRIGVGFHNKWYRSQKEHWLGWIVYQEHLALAKGRNLKFILAKERWRSLNCIPMMFWLAETAGIDSQRLEQARRIAIEEAKEISHDCPRHGKAMRFALPWVLIEERLTQADKASMAEANQVGEIAFAHLASKRSIYRKYLTSEA